MCECFACLYIRAPLVGLLLTETRRGTESLGTVVTSASQYHLWVLGAEPWSSAIAANVLTLWAISLGPELQTFYIRLSLFISEILWTHSCDSVREDGEYWWFWLSVLSEVAVNGTVDVFMRILPCLGQWRGTMSQGKWWYKALMPSVPSFYEFVQKEFWYISKAEA